MGSTDAISNLTCSPHPPPVLPLEGGGTFRKTSRNIPMTSTYLGIDAIVSSHQRYPLPCEAGEQPCQVFCASGGFQGVRVRIMQFKMVSSLRMQAVSATFGALPAASSF